MTWEDEKAWSDKYLQEIRMMLGLVLFQEPPIEQDMIQNTDLRIFTANDVRITCRIRRNKYINYKDDFTIRAKSRTGTPTELDKLLYGFGDYIFYGFAPADESNRWLAYWTIGDLSVFRSEYPTLSNRELKNNKGYDTSFYTFKWDEFSDDFIVARRNGRDLFIAK